jgi:choline-sulfatase
MPLAALALGVLLVAIAAVWWLWQAHSAAPPTRNVLLISIDTCRSDYLSCYGYPSHAGASSDPSLPPTTPNIDALAAEGTLFRNARAPVPITLAAHCSMLTGTIPPYHGIHDNAVYGFGADVTTLAEILKARGLHTGGIVSTSLLSRRYGINQGFDVYLDDMSTGQPGGEDAAERRGGDTTRLALDFLQKNTSNPFFLFLHYYDAHHPYEPPEPFASRFSRAPYAGEIAYTDDCIGQVIGKLKSLGLYDSTLVIVTGDHGEMLGEHGEACHSYFIYESALKVPLVVRVPGQKRGRIVEAPVGLIDITPTVCGLLGAPRPRGIQGADLTSSVRKGTAPPANRPYYCESVIPTTYGANSLLGLIQGNWKYIQTTRPELYDLAKDPREEHNLMDSQPSVVSEAQTGLRRMLETGARAGKDEKTGERDPAMIAKLAALGHVRGSSAEAAFDFSTNKEDPKDLIGFHEGYVAATQLAAAGKLADARDAFEKLLRQRPQHAGTSFSLAVVVFKQKDYAKALELLKQTLALTPQDYSCHLYMAAALAETNRSEEALAHFQEAEKLEPRSDEVLVQYGACLLRAGHADQSAAKFQKALQISPHNQKARLGLAMAQGKTEDVVSQYTQALKSNPSDIQAHNGLAAILLQQGAPDKALEQWGQSLRLNPNQPDVLAASARVLLGMGRPEHCLQSLQKLLEIEPNDSRVMSQIALIKADPRYPQCLNAAEALALAQKANRLAGDRDPLSLYALASALAASGKTAEAGDIAAKALGLSENTDDASLTASIKKLLEALHAPPRSPEGKTHEDGKSGEKR